MTATHPKAASLNKLDRVDTEKAASQNIHSTDRKASDTTDTKDDQTFHQQTSHQQTSHQQALKQVDDADIEQALSQLSEGDFHSRWDSAKQFVKQFQSDRSIPLVVHHLKNSTDPEQQWFLVRILGQYDQPVVVETLAQFLVTTPEPELQSEAIKSLTQIGNSAIVALAQKLQSNDRAQRRLAARTLAQIRRTAVITPLLSVARDADSQLRLIAIEALGSFHDSRVTPVLISALTDEDDIAAEAIRAIGRRTDLLADYNLVELLQQRLSHRSDTVAKESAIALGRLGTESAAIALGTFLTQPAPTAVKISAVRALSWLDSAIATAHLAVAFECIPPIIMPAIKQEIAKALGQSRTAKNKVTAAKPLVKWLKQLDPSDDSPTHFLLKQTVISSLTWLGATNATDSLIPLLADTDSRIQMHVLSALKQIDPRDAKDSVVTYLQKATLSRSEQDKLKEHLVNW